MSSPAFHGESQGHSESWSCVIAICEPVDVVKKKKKTAQWVQNWQLDILWPGRVIKQSWILIGILFAYCWMYMVTLAPLFCLCVNTIYPWWAIVWPHRKKGLWRCHVRMHCAVTIFQLCNQHWLACRTLMAKVWISIISKSIAVDSLRKLWELTIDVPDEIKHVFYLPASDNKEFRTGKPQVMHTNVSAGL